MTTPYTPRPGSLAEKVITHLNSGGSAQISPADMVKLFNVAANSTSNLMKAPLKFGIVELHKNGRKTLYTLPGIEPLWDDATGAASADAAPKTRKVKAPKKKAPPHASRKKVQAEPVEPEQPAAIASLWDDGDVVLAGITINNDAASVTLTDLQARQVHRFLERVYGPTV